MKLLSHQDLVDGLPFIHNKNDIYENCVFGKQHWDVFPKGYVKRALRKIELVHANLYGPMKTPSLNNSSYFLMLLMIIVRWHGFILPRKNLLHCIFLRGSRIMLKSKVGTF